MIGWVLRAVVFWLVTRVAKSMLGMDGDKDERRRRAERERPREQPRRPSRAFWRS
jgi:hypothetical protein